MFVLWRHRVISVVSLSQVGLKVVQKAAKRDWRKVVPRAVKRDWQKVAQKVNFRRHEP